MCIFVYIGVNDDSGREQTRSEGEPDIDIHPATFTVTLSTPGQHSAGESKPPTGRPKPEGTCVQGWCSHTYELDHTCTSQ